MGLRVAVFASGGGSNFQALAERAREYRVALLISNRAQAGVLKRAEQLEIPAHVLSPGSFENEELYIEKLRALLHKEKIDLIALAGYLSKIPPKLIELFQGRILNIHPSLLPRFGGKGLYGRYVHEAVIKAKETFSGATVHFVDEEYDTGPILIQERVPVLTDDTPDSLASRILDIEHQLFPKAIHLIAQGRVQVEGRHVSITPTIHDD
ncbi:MAG: phosphoribosylglycinamide formyltransferase [Bacteroidetes bacterium]|nr:phosphoribosylglycinamide formyltransferase [Bacteroidota bacterium]MCY4205658.1 phosphoribosylglycinamide formyltransferase [Bacteroidota bacterium]